MPRPQQRARPAKAKEVLKYFLRHPQAADTLEGVARWRLLEERVHRNVEDTYQALTWLVAEGFLSEESVRGSEAIFRLNPTRTAQAKRFVAEPRARG